MPELPLGPKKQYRSTSSSRSRLEGSRHQQDGNMRKATMLDRWVEPQLAQPKASYEDSGVAPYGVLQHMQPLGETPSMKVKQRARGEGTRKSVLSSSATLGQDGVDTPEVTPQPTEPPPTTQPIVIDDERDADYAPKHEKRRPRAAKTRASVESTREQGKKQKSTAKSKPHAPPPSAPTPKFEYDGDKLRRVVEAAKARAIEVGKPDLAAAVNEIYVQSQEDTKLKVLLEAILTQNATMQQNSDFQDYVRAAKKKLKDAKIKARQQPEAKTNGTQETSTMSTQTKLTLQPASPLPPETSTAIPSTELLEPSKPKISLTFKSPSKDSKSRRAGNGKMSLSPNKARRGSVGSDSSLTDMTSNDEDDGMELDEPEQGVATAAHTNGTQGKDQAAERGSLAVPGGPVKRSSAEAEFEDEKDRELAAKKQKLSEGLTRDFDYEESSIRPSRSAPTDRAVQRVREGARPRPSMSLQVPSGSAASTRGSRAPSMDMDSPLSDLSPSGSRQSTPRLLQGGPPRPPHVKRAKTKQSPEKKQVGAFGAMTDVGGAGRESPIGDDDNEVASENNDFCSACKGGGLLICCDGCDRSFHFTCLDPPLNDNAKELEEPWFCYNCVARRPLGTESPEKPARGLFAPLLSGLKKRNPSNFVLPEDIRTYFEGVGTDRNGSFVEALNGKPTRGKPGYSDDQPDYYKLRDSKGNLVLCYTCGKSSHQLAGPKRPIVSCDHCGQHWHLDCLDPPLANPPALNQNGKKAHDWMCPLHIDQELRKVDTALLNRRKIHIRKPKVPRVVETALPRGHRNNGIIEIIEDDTDTSESEFVDEEEDNGTVYKLPVKGIKLDFIDKVKDSRIQRMRDERTYERLHAAVAPICPSALQQANFAKRPFNEKQLALNLAQFANDNKDLDLGRDQVENLVSMLIAEAPSEVVEEMMAAEDADKAKSASSVVPPSPPASEQTAEMSAEQRKELQLLQELIRRKLESSKT